MRFILLVLWLLLALWEPVAARTIRVSEKESEHGYFALYWALIEAAPHDTLLVAAGLYEGGSIDKPLTLIGAGADSTRVAGAFTALGIGAEGVTIEGFYIRGHGKCRLTSAIYCNNCSATLKHNILEGCYSVITTSGNARLTVNYNQLLAGTFAFEIFPSDELRGNSGIESLNNMSSIDARFNWWETEKQAEIQAKIASPRKDLINISGHLTESTKKLVINRENKEDR